MKGLDVLHLTKEEEDKTLKRIIMRIKDNTKALVVGGEFTWDLTTLRSKLKKKEKLEGILAQQLTQIEARMEEITKEKRLNNEPIAKKTARKGKRVVRKDSTSLSQLEENLGMEGVELVVLRPFEEVKTNVFETTLPGWNLDDFQRG